MKKNNEKLALVDKFTQLAHFPCKKQDVVTAKAILLESYQVHQCIKSTIKAWSAFVKTLLKELSNDIFGEDSNLIAIVAIGSLGRDELLPYSDLDLLILTPENDAQNTLNKSAELIRILWDLGFSIGNQVGSPNEIALTAKDSLSTISALQDMQFITGNNTLFETLCYQTHPSQMWQARTFLAEKIKEQKKRHQKYSDKAYLLEPNVKESPGGLRDLQIIHLISKRLTQQNLKKNELDEIRTHQLALLEIRYLLHMIANKREERLLFDYQKKLAEAFGYKNDDNELAIEKLMKRYFSLIKRISELNDVVLQFFSETIKSQGPKNIQCFDKNFLLINDYLAAKHDFIFQRNPSLLLEIFSILQKNKHIKGIHSQTIRLIQNNKMLINKQFRTKNKNTALFISLLINSDKRYPLLKVMHRFGLLARYLPEFSSIVGQMQHDLFHLYTVDIHSLLTIKHIDAYIDPQYPTIGCTDIFYALDKPIILYLAALYHDLGKGKGGCHSEIGEKLVLNFSTRHKLSLDDGLLIAWLVKHHLLLSMTAQRKDLHDMQTIIDFCQVVNNVRALNYLYLLTIADIKATNSNLWNKWKESLLKTLYHKAKDYLTHQVEYDEPEIVLKCQKAALEELPATLHLDAKALWKQIKNSYFLYEQPSMIALHTANILTKDNLPIITFFDDDKKDASQLFIYAQYNENHFYTVTTVISNLNHSIAEARILKLKNGNCLHSYLLFKQTEDNQSPEKKYKKLKQQLKKYLSQTSTLPKAIKHFLTRRQKNFITPTLISFETIKNKNQTMLIITAMDRSGILANIASVFLKLKINIHHAKISTSGERIEDSFYITNEKMLALNKSECEDLESSLLFNINHR